MTSQMTQRKLLLSFQMTKDYVEKAVVKNVFN